MDLDEVDTLAGNFGVVPLSQRMLERDETGFVHAAAPPSACGDGCSRGPGNKPVDVVADHGPLLSTASTRAPGYPAEAVEAYFARSTVPFTTELRQQYKTHAYLVLHPCKASGQMAAITHSAMSEKQGGNFHVPSPTNLYFAVDEDREAGRFYPLNEMTARKARAALCFELDFGFQNESAVPQPLDAFLAPLLKAMNDTVASYLPKEQHAKVVAYVLTSPVKPKFKKSEGVYRAHLGVHVVYNVAMSIRDCNQISLAVTNTLGARYPDRPEYMAAVDSRYHTGSQLVAFVSMRPPFAAKEVDCYVCNRPEWRTGALAEHAHLVAAAAEPLPGTEGLKRRRLDGGSGGTFAAASVASVCTKCHGRKRVLDIAAIYTLHSVVNVHSERMPTVEARLRESAVELLAACSVTAANKLHLELETAPNAALLTDSEMRKVMKRQSGGTIAVDGRGRKAGTFAHRQGVFDARTLLRHLKASVRLPKRVTGRPPLAFRELDPNLVPKADVDRLHTEVSEATRRIHPEYRDTSCSGVRWVSGCLLQWSLINRMHDQHAHGNKYCMARQTANNSNRALFMLYSDPQGQPYLYAGCYNQHEDDEPPFVPVSLSQNMDAWVRIGQLLKRILERADVHGLLDQQTEKPHQRT